MKKRLVISMLLALVLCFSFVLAAPSVVDCGDPIDLDVDDTVEYEGKIVSLDDVGSASAVFSVGEEGNLFIQEIISVDSTEEVNGVEIWLQEANSESEREGSSAVFEITCDGPDVVECGNGHDLAQGSSVEYEGRYISVEAVSSSSAVFSVEDIDSGDLTMEIISVGSSEEIQGIEIILEDVDDGVAYFVIDCDGPSNVGCEDEIPLYVGDTVIYEGRYVTTTDTYPDDAASFSVEDVTGIDEADVEVGESVNINGLNIMLNDVEDEEGLATFSIDCDDSTPYQCYSDDQCARIKSCEDGFCELKSVGSGRLGLFRAAEEATGLAWYWWLVGALLIIGLVWYFAKGGCCKSKPKKRKRKKR